MGIIMSVTNDAFKLLTEAIFNLAFDIQTDAMGEASIQFENNRSEIEHQEGFSVSIKWQLFSSGISAMVGGGTGFESGSFFVKERGKWIAGTHFPLEKNNRIGAFNDSYESLFQDLVNDLPFWLKSTLGVVDLIFPTKIKSTEHPLGTKGANIKIPSSATNGVHDSIYCISWSWYGNDPNAKRSELNDPDRNITDRIRTRAEESYDMAFGIGGFYQFEPYGTLLNDTCILTLVYQTEDIEGTDESSLGIYMEDKARRKWIHIPGVVDKDRKTVQAPINQLALYTLAPRVPYGFFGLYASPDSLYSDGISVSTISSDLIYNNDNSLVPDGELFTVSTYIGEIISLDADPNREGVQVLAKDGKISFQIKSSEIRGTTAVMARSVRGSSNGSTELVFYDKTAPLPPVIMSVVSENGFVEVTWLPNSEPDVAGYLIYYDTDTILPLKGPHRFFGESSPIYSGIDTKKQVFGLFADSTYYFAISAKDVSGNESQLSSFLSTTVVTSVPQIMSQHITTNIFKIYPNPSKGRFTLELLEFDYKPTTLLEIYGLRGEKLLHRMLPNNHYLHDINLEGYMPGIYIVRIVQENKIGVERVIIR